MKAIHYIPHFCGPQECECGPRCNHREDDEIQGSGIAGHVTCKNCLKGMAADKKRKQVREAAHIRSREAWMNEAEGRP